MKKPFVLCLDDEPDNVDALERILRKDYSVLKATNAQNALQILEQYGQQIGVIISDQRMPEMTGVDFFERTIEKFPDTIRILLTGYTDLESVIRAINQGQIYRYLTKPWEPAELLATIHQAYEKYNLKKELKDKNFKLEQANKELQSFDQTKNQFMILINHELKTPLTTIISYLDLLKESTLDDEQKKFINRIEKSSNRLKDIVEDVLLIMRAETKQLKIDKQLLKFDELPTWIHTDLESEALKKSIKIIYTTNGCTAQSDKRLVIQVLNRVLHNAIKFGYANTEVNVNITQKSSFATYVEIINHGPNIKNDVIHKILKPFQLDENIMNHSTGVGLGLSVCQSILNFLNSPIQIQNIENGVNVNFTLTSEISEN